MKKHFYIFELVALLCGGLILMFIIAPIVGMVLNSKASILFETMTDKEIHASIRLTLLTSFVATMAFSVIALPFSWYLARYDFVFKNVLIGIINLPLVIPHSTAGIALLSVLNRESMAGKLAEKMGFSFINNPVGIALAMSFVSLPFLIESACSGFAGVPEKLEKAAMTLGASPLRVFFTISLPLAGRSILTGLIMMFARGLSEFGAVIIIAYHPMVTPVLIYERFTSYGLSYAREAGVVFLIVSLIVFVAIRLISEKGCNYAGR